MDMSDSNKKGPYSPIDRTLNDYEASTSEVVSDELATITIPGIDTVFEEQAALVNHAVASHWDGQISMGTVCPCRVWLDV